MSPVSLFLCLSLPSLLSVSFSICFCLCLCVPDSVPLLRLLLLVQVMAVVVVVVVVEAMVLSCPYAVCNVTCGKQGRTKRLQNCQNISRHGVPSPFDRMHVRLDSAQSWQDQAAYLSALSQMHNVLPAECGSEWGT